MATLLLIILFKTIFSLQVYCKPNDTYLGLAQKYYEITVKNPPKQTYFVIGYGGASPKLSYNETSSLWTSDIQIYSWSSYSYQLSYFTEIIGSKDDIIYHSICSFYPVPEETYLGPAIKTELVCDSLCNEFYGYCVKNYCKCDNDYFGRFCGMKLFSLHSGYSKSFKTSRYSLTFFSLGTQDHAKIRNKGKNIQV